MNKMKLNIQLFASGTISGTSTSSGGACRIVWSSTKNDANNNSSVTATVQARRTTAGYTYCTVSGTVTIDGTNKSISKYRPSSDPWNSDWKDVGTYTKTVTHNEDGSKQIKVSCNVNGDAGSMDGNFKASATVTLDKINRTSLLGEIDDFNIDDTITIPITKYISTATDTLVIKAGETTIKTVSGLSDGYNLTFTTAEKNKIKAKMTSPRIALNFTLTSVDGSTTLGTSNKSAVCIYLDMPTLFRIKKNSNGNYRLAINGPCDESGEILQIYDDDGNLINSSRSYGEYHLSNTNLPTTAIALNLADTTPSPFFTKGTNKLTCNTKGIYEVIANLYGTANGSTESITTVQRIDIRKNKEIIATNPQARYNTTVVGLNVNTIMQLEVGDEITITAYDNSPNTIEINNTSAIKLFRLQ